MSKREWVTVGRAALDELPNGSIVLRGVLDPGSLQHLQIAAYQREVSPLSSLGEIVEAFRNGGRVPDIELGMRGQNYTEKDGLVLLKDPVFIVDGLQRVSAALHLLGIDGGNPPHLGAMVHFSTTEAWERDRFRILNTSRTKVSPNVLLRNLEDEFPAIADLINLSSERTFVLGGRVSWGQRMQRDQLITALGFLKAVGQLHAHLGAGRGNQYYELARGVNTIRERIGRNRFRANIRRFFEIVDECWGIRRVVYKEGAAQLRTTFLMCLARLFSNHLDFWKGTEEFDFFVEAPLVRKIALFPVQDPEVSRLASTSGKAREILYSLLTDHVNSGKRSRRLKPREFVDPVEDGDDDNQNGDTEE